MLSGRVTVFVVFAGDTIFVAASCDLSTISAMSMMPLEEGSLGAS